MKRVRILLAAIVALLTGLAITPVAVADVAAVDYVALGDSYVSIHGVG